MDHIQDFSNKTCFSENKKAEQKSTLDYTYFYVDSFGKKNYWLWRWWGTNMFYIQEIWSLLFIVFSSQSGRIGIFKRDWKTFIKRILFIFKSNLLCKNFVDCLQNED